MQTPEHWQQVEEIFHAALERPPAERAAYIAEVCASEAGLSELPNLSPNLLDDVQAMLAAHERAGNFMEQPLDDAAAGWQAAGSPLSQNSFSHYRMLSLLGKGGMGEVWLAEDTQFGRKVAVKLLPAEFTTDAERVRRFTQEARAASALNHPNIITIHEIGEAYGMHYIVTEYVEGKTLRQRMASAPQKESKPRIEPPEAIDFAMQIAAALSAAHEAGIVHRDVKPENVMVRRDGIVKVLDFGLAKLTELRIEKTQNFPLDDPGNPQSAIRNPQSTASGIVMGTPRYMSPEQARGEKVDARTDIFSLGVILYEMLTGQPAFRGASAIEVMNAILKEEPPELGETMAKTGAQLEKIVRRCLEKKPEMRFHSAHDLGFALEALTTSSGSQLREARLGKTPAKTNWLSREKLLLAAASLLGVIALGFAWAYFTRQPATDVRVFKTSIFPPEKTSFGHAVVSPDGRWLAFTAVMGSKAQLWVRALDATEAKPLAGTEGAIYPFWSPDSHLIGYFAGGKLKKIEVSGGLPAPLCDVTGVGIGGVWNRDGVILFSSLEAGLSRVPARGGEVTPVMKPGLKRQESRYFYPYFLPDGHHFLFGNFDGQKETSGIYFGSLDGEVSQRLLGDDSNAVYAASGTGRGYLLFGREGELMAQPFDADARRLTGEPFSVARQVGFVLGVSSNTRQRNFSVSENGVLVFDPLPNQQRNQVIWVDRGGRKTGSLEGVDNAPMLRLSPDEKRFMVGRLDFQTRASDLWLSDMTGGNVTRFTFEPGTDRDPVWSPDGNHVVWGSNREGLFQLYEKADSGAGQDALLLKSDYSKFPTDWSRDGRFIIYRQLDPKAKSDVWVFPVGPPTGTISPFPFLQTEANEASASLSPDGQWMAYISDESGRYEVYVQSFPKGGSKRQVSTGGGVGPQWRGDGKELFYHAPDGKLMAVAVKGGASFGAGAPVALFEFRAGTNNLTSTYYSVTSDGQRFLLSTIVQTEATPLTVVVNWAADLKR